MNEYILLVLFFAFIVRGVVEWRGRRRRERNREQLKHVIGIDQWWSRR